MGMEGISSDKVLTTMDEDTQFQEPTLENLRREHVRLRKANEARVEGLPMVPTPQGLQRPQVSELAFLKLRLEALIDGLLGPVEGDEATVERLAFEVTYEGRAAQVLRQINTQLAQASLQVGLKPPKLIMPGDTR